MKKNLFIAVSAIMMATANVKGEEIVNLSATPKVNYKLEVPMRSMSRYLNLDENQQQLMQGVSDDFQYAVACLEDASAEQRPAHMKKALRTHLSYTREVLKPEQYRRYLIILNNTMKNKGLDTLLFEDEMAMK